MTAADLSHENLALLEAKLRADLETVMRVRALFKEHLGSAAALGALSGQTTLPLEGTAATAPTGEASTGPTIRIAADVKVLVREIVGEIEGRFKFGDIKTLMQQRRATHPDTSIRSVLMRMVQTGELKIVHYATGRGGNIFEKVVK